MVNKKGLNTENVLSIRYLLLLGGSVSSPLFPSLVGSDPPDFGTSATRLAGLRIDGDGGLSGKLSVEISTTSWDSANDL